MKTIALKCYQQVAAVIGEACADYELQRVISCEECYTNNYNDIKGEYLDNAFLWKESPQKHEFWDRINCGQNPYEHGHKKPYVKEWMFINGEWHGDIQTSPRGDILGTHKSVTMPDWVPEEQPNQKLKEASQKAEDVGFDKPTNKYKVLCKGVEIDVYDVLMAYSVTNPADQHAIKKMLMPGKRGVKDANQDRREAIQSLERAIELAQSDK